MGGRQIVKIMIVPENLYLGIYILLLTTYLFRWGRWRVIRIYRPFKNYGSFVLQRPPYHIPAYNEPIRVPYCFFQKETSKFMIRVSLVNISVRLYWNVGEREVFINIYIFFVIFWLNLSNNIILKSLHKS